MSQPIEYPQGAPNAFGAQPPYYPPQQQQHPPSSGYPGYPPSMHHQFSLPAQQPYPQQQGPQQYPQYQQFQQPQQSQPRNDSYYPPQQQAHASPGSPSQPPSQQQAQGGQANQVDKAADPHGWALAEYGSPYAHSKDWRASPSDLELTGFPEQKLMLRVKQRFSRSPGDVWSKPAPSFGRPPQQGWSYAAFQPFSLPASGEQLADGFKPLYPGRILANHDVSAADWCRFLEDLSVAGRMTGAQQVISNFAPVTAHLGATGFLVTKALQKRMKRGKEPVITETVEMWEQNFFLPRGLDVYVRDTEGRMTARAPGDQVPGSNHPNPTEIDAHSNDSEDGSSDESTHHEKTRKEKKKERDERKKERKAEKKKKKEEEKKNKKKPRFYLIVAPYQP
ncbi:hypothetical protein EX895_002623 [Sporisorium graminicola]|uniref:Uncharacterized protein n=1 Tax=Sporisorium graminicola TaxID=280036 RepID=A0A4U7KUL5_9BASI|nr:hypothetical protein EX895_002623 [Sporisorium graminicola]TKY88271.1 hypothetical protein EX895_002623 [Sporisorium graminicola]